MSDAEHLLENIYEHVCEYEEYNNFDINDGEFTSEDIKRFHLEGFAKNGQLEVSDDVLRWLFSMAHYCSRRFKEDTPDCDCCEHHDKSEKFDKIKRIVTGEDNLISNVNVNFSNQD